MKKTVFALLIVLLGFYQNFSLAAATPSSDFGLGFELKKKTLSNGLIVIIVEDHTVPVVSYQTWFKVGSVDEKNGIRGIAHLFEHLMFKGTDKYPAKSFFSELEAKGAEVNAFTTRDYTAFYQNFTPNLLEKVIDMEADRMHGLKLSEEGLRIETQVVFEERKLRTDNSPDGRIQEILWALAFHEHPYRWPVVGFTTDLINLKVEDLQSFYDRYYQPSNASIIVVGDVESKKVFDGIEKAYSKISSKKVPGRAIPLEPEQDTEVRRIVYDHVASDQFMHGYHVSSAFDDDTYALDVLANVLFQGKSSRLYRKLVEDLDLATAVNGMAFTPTFPGLFLISVNMSAKHRAEEAETILDQEFKKAQESDVSKEEIDRAVKQLTMQMVDSVRTPYGLGQFIGTVQTILGDPESYKEDIKKYQKVTAADLKRVAKKYLVASSRTAIVMRPKEFEGKK